MSIEKVAKKFMGEPFIWVCLSMVGVVLMGPAAANLARKAVGGDRNRGNIDEHGETITESLPLAQNTRSGDRAGSSEASFERQRKMDAGSSPTINQKDGSSGRSHAGSNRKENLSTDDVVSNVARRAQDVRDRKRISDGPASANLPGDRTPEVAEQAADADQVMDAVKEDDSFDIDQMVGDVKREMNAEPADLEAVRGSATKKMAETQEAAAGSDSKDVAQMPAEEGSSSKTAEPVVDFFPPGSHTPTTPQGELSQAQTDSILVEPGQIPMRETLKGRDAMGNDLVQESIEPERDSSTASQMLRDDQSVFSPWDEPLKFKAGSETRGTVQDQRTRMNQMPQSNVPPSIAPESGDAWWNGQIAQQFWPERQAQFASIDSVVFIALQNSAQIQILNDRPRIEETFVRQREADFDWSAFVDASWNSIDEPIRSELQTGSRTGRFVQEELAVSSGLQRRLDRGGELRVGSSIGTVDNNSIFLAPPDQGTATFSLDYRQPLLRGRGREVTQSQIVLARLNVEASQHSVRKQMQEYLVDVVTAYWELYRARGVLSQRHKSYLRATEVVQRLSGQSSNRARVQVQRAQTAASARQSEVIDAEYIVADAQERLMNLTHGDGLVNSNEIEIIPTDSTPHSSLPHDLTYVTQLAVQNRAEVKEVLAEIKAASVRQVIALDGLKPQLDAIISSYVAGVRGNKDVGNAIVDQFSAGDPSYSVGMSFEIPIGRRAANASTKREEIHRRLLENKLRKTLGDVSMSARSAFRDVYRLMAMTENNRQVVAQSADALNSVQQDIGWLEKDDPSSALFLNDLLGSQDRLAEAEQNLLDSQARLAIAYVRLKRETGELLRDDAGLIESNGCSTCGDVGAVTQASWNQPIEHVQTIIEDGKEFIQDMGDRFKLPTQQERGIETFDVPLQRPPVQPGVTPMPHGSDTAGEILSAPVSRYPLSSQRASDWVPPRY